MSQCLAPRLALPRQVSYAGGLMAGAHPLLGTASAVAPGWAVPAWHRALAPEVWPCSLLPLVPLVPSYEESSTPKEVPGASKEETTEAAKKKK